MKTRLCRHCGQAPMSRPRRLCWVCYYTPEVRHMYPPADCMVLRRGLGLEPGRRPPPPFPTTAPPGSPEKIAILQQRNSQGFELWHPDDALVDRRLLYAAELAG
jgi:hypothetical protein